MKYLFFGALAYFSVVIHPVAAPVDHPSKGVANQVIERGPNHRVVQNVYSITNRLGKVVTRTNTWTELETGMHYMDANRKWQESKSEIRVRPNGTAVADTAGHKAIFAPNLNTRNALTLKLPGGADLKSHVLGIAFYDFRKEQSVLIAELKDSVGTVVGDNQVIYADAFTDVKADVRYTYTKDGLEQDIILRERPPLPESFGFDPRSTRMEVWTEFVDAPESKTEQSTRKGWIRATVDKAIDFGTMRIGSGSAFGLGGGEDKKRGIAVQKHWQTINNRTFLIEEVPYRYCVPYLRALPQGKQGAALKKNGVVGEIADHRLLPEPKMASAGNGEKMRVAGVQVKDQGFVLDYSIVTSTTNFTFQADRTYLVLGTVNLSGQTTIEGGAVIKYTNSASAMVKILGSVNCLADTYRPAVFTSLQDDSAGDTIRFLDGPAGSHYNTALWLENGGTLQYCHFRYADTAVFSDSNYTVKHSQFVHCSRALQTEDATFEAKNLLLYDVGIGFYGKFFHGTAEHVTFDQGTYVTDDWFFDPGNCEVPPSSSLTLVNSLITAVGGYGIVPLYGDHVTFLSSDSGVYKSVGGAKHYLADSSSYRGMSLGTISSDLADDLKKLTTYAPVVYANDTFVAAATLGTQANRDSALSDLGYHYAPLDYCLGDLRLSEATLSISSGVAVGFFTTNSSYGALTLECGATLASEGSPTNLNHLVWYNTVQEEATNSWSDPYARETFSYDNYSCSGIQMNCRFTDFSRLGGGNSFHIGYGAAGFDGTMSFRDCQFHGGRLNFSLNSEVSTALAIGLTNCLFERTALDCWGAYGPLSITAYNNLFYKDALVFDAYVPESVAFTFHDNFFVGNTIDQSESIGIDHGANGYITNCTRLEPQNPEDKIVPATFAFEQGVLGRYYQPTNSPLLNAGSRDATLAGLYHFTTTANNVKETNSVVDIGFHYVAMESDQLPDSDNDGTPDYLEDSDGDGMPDDWETAHGFNPFDPTDANDDPDGDWVKNLQEYLTNGNPNETMVVAWGDNMYTQCEVPSGLRNVVALAGGSRHSMVLHSNGTVSAWGENSVGQTNIPNGLTNVLGIDAGTFHNIVVHSNGTVTAWGKWWTESYPDSTVDPYNGIDKDTSENVSVPSGLTNIIAVAAGNNHDLALRADGTVVAWGIGASSYTTVPAGLTNVVAISAGYTHNVALLSDSTVVAWGESYDDERHWGVTNVPVGLSNVVAISAGAFHTLALKSDGSVVAWGSGTALDEYWYNYQSVVPEDLTNAVAIGAGAFHSAAIRTDGTLVLWGYMEPTIPYIGENLVALNSGAHHDVALRGGRQTPIIIRQPQDLYAGEGQTVSFDVLASGLADLHYQWQFGGNDIPGATTSKLTLSNVQSNNIGSYQVQVSSGAGSVWSSIATLTLVHRPQITLVKPAVPSTLWVTSNTNLTVNATTEYYLPIQYEWIRNSNVVSYVTWNVFDLQTSTAAVNLNGDYSVNVSNVAGPTNVGVWRVRAFYPGMVGGFGANTYGQSEPPTDLTNAVAIAAGGNHSMALKEDGTVVQWGTNWTGVPANLFNVIAIAAGDEHSLAVRDDGTVVAWGKPNHVANSVPANLTGVSAVAAGLNHNLALLTNGTVVTWGTNLSQLMTVPSILTNVSSIAAGQGHSLALCSNGLVVAWGLNAEGQTNVPSTLSNVVAIAAGGKHSLALKKDGTVVGWGDNNFGQCTPPVGMSNIMAIAAGSRHSAALKNDGTVVVWGDGSSGQTNIGGGMIEVKLLAAGGDHTLASRFSMDVQYPITVANDVLLIHNTNSVGSTWCKDYYLAHRPRVGEANVLGVGLPAAEKMGTNDFLNNLKNPVLSWLAANPTKHPNYFIVFIDIPTRMTNMQYPFTIGSVDYVLREYMPGVKPFITRINMQNTNDCKGYIDKLEYFGTNYSAGKLVIGAGAGEYNNTNYVIDNVLIPQYSFYSYILGDSTNAILTGGVPRAALNYQELPQPHISNAVNVAGYATWGKNAGMGPDYSTNGAVTFTGDSSWYVIQTVESYNGQVQPSGAPQGNFTKWFSPRAFGGTNYANTPIGAVTHVEEPFTSGVNDSAIYFGYWVRQRTFANAAWKSRKTPYFQAVGDPFIRRSNYRPAIQSSTLMLAHGWDHNVLLKANGTVVTCGRNDKGQLGYGTMDLSNTNNAPKSVPNLPGAQAVEAHGRHSLALMNDGTIKAWGWNSYGQLGDLTSGYGGDTANRADPVTVVDANGKVFGGVIAIGSSDYSSYAIKSGGTLWKWGQGYYNESFTSPQQVMFTNGAPFTGAVAVGGGNYHYLVLRNDTTLWGWGYNAYGQLGDGTTTSRNYLVQVKNSDGSTLSNVVKVCSGTLFSMALKSDGTVWSWGDNSYGQLGDGTTTNRLSPVRVLNSDGSVLSNAVSIAVGQYHASVYKADGTVWAWGRNHRGQLGNGSTNDVASPTQVMVAAGIPLTGASAPRNSNTSSWNGFALRSGGTLVFWGYGWWGNMGIGQSGVDKTYPNSVVGIP